jgi:hypothetical protein
MAPEAAIAGAEGSLDQRFGFSRWTMIHLKTMSVSCCAHLAADAELVDAEAAVAPAWPATASLARPAAARPTTADAIRMRRQRRTLEARAIT